MGNNLNDNGKRNRNDNNNNDADDDSDEFYNVNNNSNDGNITYKHRKNNNDNIIINQNDIIYKSIVFRIFNGKFIFLRFGHLQIHTYILQRPVILCSINWLNNELGYDYYLIKDNPILLSNWKELGEAYFTLKYSAPKMFNFNKPH